LEQQLYSFSVILQFKFGKMKLQKCWSQSLTALSSFIHLSTLCAI